MLKMQKSSRTKVLAGCDIYKNFPQKVSYWVTLEISIYALTVSEYYNSQIAVIKDFIKTLTSYS